jgi:hypothetical protein
LVTTTSMRTSDSNLFAQASQALVDAVAWALLSTGILRPATGSAGCWLPRDVSSAEVAAGARVGPDMAVTQMLAGRPW